MEERHLSRFEKPIDRAKLLTPVFPSLVNGLPVSGPGRLPFKLRPQVELERRSDCAQQVERFGLELAHALPRDAHDLPDLL